ALAMRLFHPFVTTDQRGERYAFRRGKRRVPAGAMFHGRGRLAARVGRRARRLMSDELFTAVGMLAFGKPLELLHANFTAKSPAIGESSMPLPDDPIAGAVVVLAGILKLFGVIAFRLPGTEGLRDRQHDRLGYRKNGSCAWLAGSWASLCSVGPLRSGLNGVGAAGTGVERGTNAGCFVGRSMKGTCRGTTKFSIFR